MLKRANQHDPMIDFIERGEIIGNIQAKWTAVPLVEIRNRGHGHPWMFF